MAGTSPVFPLTTQLEEKGCRRESKGNMTNPPSNTLDDENVGTIRFLSDDYRFLMEGLKALRKHLDQFESVKKEFELEESPYDRLIDEIDHIVSIVEPKLQQTPRGRQMPIYEHGMRIASLRLLKAGGLFTISQIQAKRNEFLKKHPRVPMAVLASIDEKISQKADLLEQGILNGLPPADIFFEMTTEPEQDTPRMPLGYRPQEMGITPSTRTTVPLYLDRIPIVDQELRDRCLPLLNSLQSFEIPENEKATRLDTAVREMSVILEDRVRKVAGLEDAHLEGVKLMAAAFSGDNIRLRFSQDQSIQESAHHLYRGYSGFVRNEVMHRLVKTYTNERVLQLLGHVDYLLSLLTQAKAKDVEECHHESQGR